LPGVEAADALTPAGDFLGTSVLEARSRRSDAFRVAVPPGTTSLRLPVLGDATVRVAGAPLAPRHGWYLLPAPAAGGTTVEIDVVHDGAAGGGGLWSGSLEVLAVDEAPLALGDWSTLGMRDWSGGVRYRTFVDGPVQAAALDLGAVRGTAELRVSGRPAGCRLWSPYRFDVTGMFDQDRNVVEVDVYNTLAPYVGAVSPTPWVLPGQTVSGLLGPVTLRGPAVHEDPASTTTQGKR
jgi:hypothetical protein